MREVNSMPQENWCQRHKRLVVIGLNLVTLSTAAVCISEAVSESKENPITDTDKRDEIIYSIVAGVLILGTVVGDIRWCVPRPWDTFCSFWKKCCPTSEPEANLISESSRDNAAIQ